MPNSRFRHVYAIVRIDSPVDQDHPENSVSVVKVLSSADAADAEAMRLNKLNTDKGCSYLIFTTRLVP